jgi:hypothetical protein
MQTEISVRMRLGIRGDFGEPWRWHHDARGGDRTLVERVEARRIDGMSDGKIVRVDDEELRVCGVTESLSDGPGLSRER